MSSPEPRAFNHDAFSTTANSGTADDTFPNIRATRPGANVFRQWWNTSQTAVALQELAQMSLRMPRVSLSAPQIPAARREGRIGGNQVGATHRHFVSAGQAQRHSAIASLYADDVTTGDPIGPVHLQSLVA